MGSTHRCGRFGSILAPIVVNLLPAPGVWLGAICFISTVCVLLLQETRGSPVDEHLADGAWWGSRGVVAERTLQEPEDEGDGRTA